MNQFNYLPPELIEFIFNKVNLNDLINLRIVDKKFKEICHQIRIKQLCVDYEYNNFWFYSNDPTYSNEENLIRTTKFLNYKSIFRLNKYLKRLAIWPNNDFKISILNEFKELEQLEIMSVKLDDNFKLILSNLKIASIYFGNNANFKLTLDTNQLFALKSSSSQLDQFVFNYQDKILFYETDDYEYDKIEIFNNLEYMKLNIHLYTTIIDSHVLSKFKNLKILDLNLILISDIEYDNLKEFIISILDEKENLKISQLQIYLNGVKLINQNQVKKLKLAKNYVEFQYNQLEFQIKNYDLFKENCIFINQLNYCDLIKLIKIIPSSLVNKFYNINQVYANERIDNEDQFFGFLKDLPYLIKLELINCGLTKSFYDQLIDFVYLNNLECLKIEDSEDLNINFDFIFNLKQLEQFETNQKMNYRFTLIYKLFEKNENLCHFEFKFDLKNYIKICKDTQLKIKCYYLGDRLEKIEKFSINFNENSNLEDVISILKSL